MSVEAQWSTVVSCIQDICNANEAHSLDNLYVGQTATSDAALRRKVLAHKRNVADARRLVQTAHRVVQTLIERLRTASSTRAAAADASPTKPAASGKGSGKGAGKTASVASSPPSAVGKRGAAVAAAVAASPSGATAAKNKKVGRLYHTSPFNPSFPIVVGSEVAYRLRNRHTEEWIQCEVMRVAGGGSKFEIRDPEPDENNNLNPSFKATYKEVLLIPPVSEAADLVNYPYGTQVLARYPETTTFYTAVVVGHRKDRVKLKFDGEDEVNKETEVERRLVLPFPG